MWKEERIHTGGTKHPVFNFELDIEPYVVLNIEVNAELEDKGDRQNTIGGNYIAISSSLKAQVGQDR